MSEIPKYFSFSSNDPNSKKRSYYFLSQIPSPTKIINNDISYTNAYNYPFSPVGHFIDNSYNTDLHNNNNNYSPLYRANCNMNGEYSSRGSWSPY